MTRTGVFCSVACLAALALGLLAASSRSWAEGEATAATSYGLEWPGTGATRRMLYWANPQSNGLPIYDATYIFKVYPRKKLAGSCAGCPSPYSCGASCSASCCNEYWTTFFWGNNGTFGWDGGSPDTYYGAHPYPGLVPGTAPHGTQAWEISVRSNDYMDPDGAAVGQEVTWNTWYTQAFTATKSGTTYTHKFYYDLSDTSKVITIAFTDPNWNTSNPPNPAVVMGQSPNLNGNSWGGYPGWEEFNGVIRGIQIYSNDLSLADIQSEIASPKSTAAGAASIWYLNLDPRPSDVTDKKASGTPHNPSWDGTTALEWSSTVTPTPPPTPTGLRVN